MKRLVLLFLLTMSSICSASKIANIHMMYTYQDVPEWAKEHDALLQSALITSSWAAKLEVYTFEVFDYSDCIVFAANCEGGSFFLRFFSESNRCEVEFNAVDDSFSYCSFKRIMDSCFLLD